MKADADASPRASPFSRHRGCSLQPAPLAVKSEPKLECANPTPTKHVAEQNDPEPFVAPLLVLGRCQPRRHKGHHHGGPLQAAENVHWSPLSVGGLQDGNPPARSRWMNRLCHLMHGRAPAHQPRSSACVGRGRFESINKIVNAKVNYFVQFRLFPTVRDRDAIRARFAPRRSEAVRMLGVYCADKLIDLAIAAPVAASFL